jgi:starch-binding outer membrane protein, SusD/RagB family
MNNKHQYISLNRKFLYCVLALAVFTSMGCKKFVEVEPPKSQLLGELVFEEQSTAVAALSGIYTQLRSDNNGIMAGGPMGMPIYMAQYTDEMVNHSNRNQNYGENFYKCIIYPDSEDIYSLWSTTYNEIYTVNSIISGLNKSNKLTEDQKAQVKGEAIFIRAMLHFYLVNLFGDIPYITSPDYLSNKSLSRMPTATVYEHILEDLQASEALVGEDYPSAERVRPNKYVVRALMARVYLYKQDWANAEAMATSVIGNPTYQWVDDLNKEFLKQSTATIWAFKPNSEGVNTEEGFMFIERYNPIPNGRSITTFLLNAFETGDKRRTNWIDSFSEAGNTWYFPFKYKQRNNSGTSKEYSVIFRLAEQYLIRAEARAQQENISGAQSDLDKIRTRAGLPGTMASTKQQLLDAILHERQVELFTEFGHRFFDLKRMGKSNEILSVIKPNWKPGNNLLPIPEKELLVNPNLNPQNPGY